MSVTIQITHSGVYDQAGLPIPVGTQLKMDAEPTGWINKYVVCNNDADKTMEVATPTDQPKRRGRPRKRSEG